MPTDSAGLCGTKNFEDLALDQLDPPVHETGQLVDPVQDGAQLHRRTPFLVEAGAPCILFEGFFVRVAGLMDLI